MTIEIHQPELEALIRERLKSGAFRNVEEILLQALKSSQSLERPTPSTSSPKKSMAKFLLESPLSGSGLKLERQRDYPRPIDL
jgi:hypothetical protein